MDEGSLDRAMKNFNVSIKLNPGFGGAYFNRALIWSYKKKLQNEVDDLRLAVHFDPNHSQALNKLAWKYVTHQNYFDPQVGLKMAQRSVNLER